MALVLVSGILLFTFGYYLGNQVGKVAHVREHLASSRSRKRL